MALPLRFAWQDAERLSHLRISYQPDFRAIAMEGFRGAWLSDLAKRHEPAPPPLPSAGLRYLDQTDSGRELPIEFIDELLQDLGLSQFPCLGSCIDPIDTKPVPDRLNHPQNASHFALGQQVNLQVEVRSPIADIAKPVLPNQHHRRQ